MVITFIHGPMMAGKTSRIYKGYKLAKRYKLGVSIIKPHLDTRYDSNVVQTHNGKIIKEDVYVLGKDKFPHKSRLRMVMIDEAQFFSIEEIQFIIKKCEEAGSSFCTFFGLDLDYAKEPFPSSEYLLKYANLKETLSGECSVCGNDSKFTQRLSNGFPAPVGRRIVIGGADTYESRCEQCYVHPSEVEELF